MVVDVVWTTEATITVTILSTLAILVIATVMRNLVSIEDGAAVRVAVRTTEIEGAVDHGMRIEQRPRALRAPLVSLGMRWDGDLGRAISVSSQREPLKSAV